LLSQAAGITRTRINVPFRRAAHVLFNYFETTGHTEGKLGITNLFSFLVYSCNGAFCIVIKLWDEQLTNITVITNGQRNVSVPKTFQTHIPPPLPLLMPSSCTQGPNLTTTSTGRIFRYGEYSADYALNVSRNGCWSKCKQSVKFVSDINPHF